ncbi:MAG: hypothetical protein K8L91_16745 [Anaerolineae bacterium]|nr:hypothetical protein [Anaerolineae bacterium]
MSGQSFPPPNNPNDPFGQQQQPQFGQQPQQPFGQPQFGQQQPYGFGQAPYGGFVQEEPKRRRRRGPCCIILVLVGVCLLCCVGGVGAFAFAFRPAVPALLWISLANNGEADQTGSVVCKDSQAELFSLAYQAEYGSDVTINFTTFNTENDSVTIEGEMKGPAGSWSTTDDPDGDGTVDYEAVFTVNRDGTPSSSENEAIANFFGCIESINQISPTSPLGSGLTPSGN